MPVKAKLWTQNALATELGIAYRTLGKRLKELPPAGKAGTRSSDAWYLSTVLDFLHNGDHERLVLDAERARVAKENADRLAIQNALARRELLPADEVARADEGAMGGIG